jgi:hypothetical protein
MDGNDLAEISNSLSRKLDFVRFACLIVKSNNLEHVFETYIKTESLSQEIQENMKEHGFTYKSVRSYFKILYWPLLNFLTDGEFETPHDTGSFQTPRRALANSTIGSSKKQKTAQ